MNCPNCGNVVQEDALFCDQCGQRLQASESDPELANAPQGRAPTGPSHRTPSGGGPHDSGRQRPQGPPQVTLCPGCGAENLPGELFCAECGTPLEAPTPMEIAPSEQMDESDAESRLGENDATATEEIERADVPVDVLGPSDPDMASEPVSPPGGPAPPELPLAPAGTVSDDEARALSCMACGAEIRADDTFCFACGVRLTNQRGGGLPSLVVGGQAEQVVEREPAPPAREEPVELQSPEEARPDTCPSCGARVSPGDLFCDACGAALTSATSAAAVGGGQREAAPEALAVDAGGEQPFLVIASSGVEIPLPQGTEVLVGREDPYSNVFPDVDLSPHDGEEAGVSRRHFKLTLAEGRYAVQDLGSTNYTWVNQRRLEPDTPTRVEDGDEIRAGRLKMIFRTRS
jgi:hypothetical protein